LPSMIAVTAADAGYFELLRDLLLSLEAARPQTPERPEGADLAVGLFDLGLTAEQLAWLDGRVTRIVTPGWDLAVPPAVRAARPHARALTVRPFLPQHFPGYDTYLWIDADVWVQSWQGIELFRHAARLDPVAAAPHTDRAFPLHRRMVQRRHASFAAGYGKAEADLLCLENHLNAGVYAARAGSPLWALWAEVFQQGIDASNGADINDQTALNYAWHRRGLSVHLLPANCNWTCHMAKPAWNPRTRQFCEPFLPFAPIALLHLCGLTRQRVYDLAGLDGQRHRMSLRYPGGQQAREAVG